MRTIAIINFKGGTGKTTTALNLSVGLALRGHRTLIIDADPQAGLTVSLGQGGGQSLKHILMDNGPWQACRTPAQHNLDLIPADSGLQEADRYLIRQKNEDHTILSQALRPLSGYQFVIFDCGPSMSALNENILHFSQEIIVPVAMDYLAMAGLLQVSRYLKDLNTTAHNHLTIVPTFYDQRQRKSQDTMRLLKHQYGAKLTRPIRSNVKLSEAASQHKAIYTHAPRSYGAADYAYLVEHVAQNQPI